jgi:lipopolysaccharide/colanic/teichoic acid biosynthesis glycosyltransferase
MGTLDTPECGLPKWKRALDLLLLASLSPSVLFFFLCISIYIKLVSKGPVFFKQERIGYRGKPFMMLKFRSMHYGAATEAQQQHLEDLIKSNKPMQKLDVKGDKRLIPLGRILRATGLDELPQLINVLKGEMSVVGPRPSTHYEFVMFQPWHKERLNALPGLTGLWQVRGKNKTTFDEMVKLDIFYARNQSIRFDLKVVLMTFPALLEQVKDHLKRPSSTTSRRSVEKTVGKSTTLGKS